MRIAFFWSDAWTAALVNHLWQSTVAVLAAWLLTLALKRNHARTRYWVWMVASLKFLLPFSLFIAGGEWLRSAMATPIQKPALAAVMEQVTQPFSQPYSFIAEPTFAPHHVNPLPFLLLALWACGSLTVAISWARKWSHVRAAVRLASPKALAADVPVLASASLLEPGIFGIARPVLLLPEGILDRLTEVQFRAIIAHEMCHVRRRDNLTFSLHMVVEVLFWFHPLVWWIRTRLIEERERACDEAVLQSGGEAEVYAEGILNVCKFYVESPLACVSGVTGSDLKKRIVRIMTNPAAHKLDVSRKLLLTAAAAVAIAVPSTFGLVHAAQIQALAQVKSATQEHAVVPNASATKVSPSVDANADADSDTPVGTYEVVTIKPNPRKLPGLGDAHVVVTMANPGNYLAAGGGHTEGGVFRSFPSTLKELVANAYGIRVPQVSGGPGWTDTDRFDVVAKMDDETAAALEKLPPKQQQKQHQLMLQAVLADRFQLRVRQGDKEIPVYQLVVAKGGLKLKPSTAPIGPDGKQDALMSAALGSITAKAVTAKNLADLLNWMVDRVVVDKTGLTGAYDLKLTWTPDEHPAAVTDSGNGVPIASTPGPTIFSALQNQLGLKLEPVNARIGAIVIDHAEQPSPN